jgi:hypothetical protein
MIERLCVAFSGPPPVSTQMIEKSRKTQSITSTSVTPSTGISEGMVMLSQALPGAGAVDAGGVVESPRGSTAARPAA